MNWLAHVANHRSAALWRLHALHHSQEDMSVFTTFRTHPFTHAVVLCRGLARPWCSGPAGPCRRPRSSSYGCLVTLPHANLRWTFGPLGRVLVSPAFHRLHHARRRSRAAGRSTSGSSLVAGTAGALRRSSRTAVRRSDGDRRPPRSLEQKAVRPQDFRVVVAQMAQPFGVQRRDGRPGMIGSRPAFASSRSSSATHDLPIARDLALLGARIALAWVFIYHGGRTLFGWFGGPGSLGRRLLRDRRPPPPGEFFATSAASSSCSAGSPSASASSAGGGCRPRRGHGHRHGTVTFSKGSPPSSPGGGYELNLALLGVALVVAILGTGRFSLDVVIRNYLARRNRGPAGAAGGSPARQAPVATTAGLIRSARPEEADGIDPFDPSDRRDPGPGRRALPRSTRPGWVGWRSRPCPVAVAEAIRILVSTHVVLYGDQALLELGARRGRRSSTSWSGRTAGRVSTIPGRRSSTSSAPSCASSNRPARGCTWGDRDSGAALAATVASSGAGSDPSPRSGRRSQSTCTACASGSAPCASPGTRT